MSELSELEAHVEELRTRAQEAIQSATKARVAADDAVAKAKADQLRALEVAEKVGLPREAMAAASGLSESTIGNWLRPVKETVASLPISEPDEHAEASA
jgi:hypothetical protein